MNVGNVPHAEPDQVLVRKGMPGWFRGTLVGAVVVDHGSDPAAGVPQGEGDDAVVRGPLVKAGVDLSGRAAGRPARGCSACTSVDLLRRLDRRRPDSSRVRCSRRLRCPWLPAALVGGTWPARTSWVPARIPHDTGRRQGFVGSGGGYLLTGADAPPWLRRWG